MEGDAAYRTARLVVLVTFQGVPVAGEAEGHLSHGAEKWLVFREEAAPFDILLFIRATGHKHLEREMCIGEDDELGIEWKRRK